MTYKEQIVKERLAMAGRRMIVSPEGLALSMNLASAGSRLSAFLLDISFIYLSIILIYTIFSNSGFSNESAYSLASLFAFIIFNGYFIYFELAWKGRTPGKALCGTMVVNRHGGELTPTAIVARNLTRQLEFYIPLFFLVSIPMGLINGNLSWIFFAWILVVSFLPVLTKDRLRLGDYIGGTLVIMKPQQVLAEDLSKASDKTSQTFNFTPEQLAIYGYLELRILEDFLRRADQLPMPKGTNLNGLNLVAQKIKNRLGYSQPIPAGLERRFLIDFYTAQRAVLERALLFGQQKWNQYLGYISVSAAAAGQLPPAKLGNPARGKGPGYR
ncbi:MAG: RDD family protein [Deltaproteobacteria bacterium]|jgi:uncharacterized RDD family membrane protein YckC|nr:RDD family protein [Deltaproteobacteria bacterium]